MDKKTEEGVQGTEGEIYKKTSTSSIRLRQKNKDRSRCIRLYYKEYYLWNMKMRNGDQWLFS